jgi:hypothetical protein
MDPVVLAAATALVGAMATDAWREARTAVVAWWRRVHPERADGVSAELEAVRAEVLAARARGDEDTEQALAGTWRLQLQRLLAETPDLGPGLRRLLDKYLAPGLPTGQQARVQQIVINAEARDQARQFIAGRDVHITGS